MCEFVHSHPSMWHEQRTKWKQCTSLSRANFFSPNNQQTPCLLLIAAARARFTHQSSYMFMCVIQWATSRLSEAHLVQTSRECAKRSLTSHGCFAGVEHNSTVVNHSLRICDVKIWHVVAFAESMNRAWGRNLRKWHHTRGLLKKNKKLPQLQKFLGQNDVLILIENTKK